MRICTGAAVGAGSVLLPGVTLGAWALAGAGSVVRADVPDHGLVVGNPARLIGWVCACGERVEGGDEGLVCATCRARYGAMAGGPDWFERRE